MLVRDAMTRRVHSIRVDKKLAAARAIMDWAQIGHLPVVDATGGVVGVVTRETIHAAAPSEFGAPMLRAEIDRKLAATPVGNALIPDVPTVTPDTRASEAALLMAEHRVPCLPVIEGGRLAGLVTRSNLLDIVDHFVDRPAAGR